MFDSYTKPSSKAAFFLSLGLIFNKMAEASQRSFISASSGGIAAHGRREAVPSTIVSQSSSTQLHSVSPAAQGSSFVAGTHRRSLSSGGAVNNPNGPHLTVAAADFLNLGQLQFEPTLSFVLTNRVVALLQKTVERLELLTLLDTTEPSTFSEAKAEAAAKMAETDYIASRMIGTKRTGLTRSACLFTGPQGRALQKTVTAVTNAILAATNTQHRGRPSVAETLQVQRQLEIRYGELLRKTRKIRPRPTDPVIDTSNFSHIRDPELAKLQHELKSVSAKLREHNKILCIQLKDNMNDGDNWVKVSNERQELMALLQSTIFELCTGYEESRIGRGGGGVKGGAGSGTGGTTSFGGGLNATMSLMGSTAVSRIPYQNNNNNLSVSAPNNMSANATSLFAGTIASGPKGTFSGGDNPRQSVTKKSSAGSMAVSPPGGGGAGAGVSMGVSVADGGGGSALPSMKRFGSAMPMKRAKGFTQTGPRIPLVSSYETFARKILREQAAQRWADELVKKERELNQNVKQLQSDLLLERSLKEKELLERGQRIEELRVALRSLRYRMKERSEEAKEQVEAATEGLQRQAADEDRLVTEEMLEGQQQLEVEHRTFNIFFEHLRERAAVMDRLGAEWAKKNQTEIKAVEARKIDAEQARQQTSEKLRDIETEMAKQKDEQQERNTVAQEEEKKLRESEKLRYTQHVAASQIESAIKAMFTRNALEKMKKKGRKKKKKASPGK